MRKDKFIRRFQKRFLLRFHMSLILLATCLSGVLFSKLLLLLQLRNVLIRYPLTACLSYLAFLLLIKLWLWYVSTTARQKARDTVDALVDPGSDLIPDLPEAVTESEFFAGGGGGFGCGGASGSFTEGGSSAVDIAAEAGQSA